MKLYFQSVLLMSRLMSLLIFSTLLSMPSLARVDHETQGHLKISLFQNSLEFKKNITRGYDHDPNHYYSYNFGPTYVNSSRFITFTLTSEGPGVLHLNGIRLWGDGYYGQGNCPQFMPPGTRCNISIEFHPWYPNQFRGQLAFFTSDGNYFIDLFGWGVPW